MHSHERYRLVRTIASGGMALVYEAILVGAHGFKRRVAIKRVLPQHSHDPAMRRMFFDEAQLASRMHHGNIVQILDFGMIDDSEFIAMEYVDGVDSARAVRAGLAEGTALPEALALHVVSQVAHALHYVHTLCEDEERPGSIIHRDVAPDNVLLSWQGDVKLSDFGVALALGDRERTRSGMIKGKRSFMAPEQALGLRVSGAADVYALGGTLRALLTCDEASEHGSAIIEPSDPSEATLALIEACTQIEPGARPTAFEVAERSGELVARLLGRDARGALCEWLEPLRPGLSRRNPLDEAFELDLVPLGGRAFTVSRAWGAALPRTLSAAWPEAPSAATELRAGAGSVRLDEGTPRHALQRRGWRWVALAAALVLGGASGAATWIWRTDAAGPEPPDLRAAAKTPSARATGETPRVVPGPAEETSPQRRPVPPLVTAPIAPAKPEPAPAPRSLRFETPRSARPGQVLAKRRPRREVRPREQVHPRARDAPARTSLRSSGRGWLRVGGMKLAGAHVVIDGRASGYAPFEHELTAGEHHLVVFDAASGQALVDQTVLIHRDHTRSNPQRVIR